MNRPDEPTAGAGSWNKRRIAALALIMLGVLALGLWLSVERPWSTSPAVVVAGTAGPGNQPPATEKGAAASAATTSAVDPGKDAGKDAGAPAPAATQKTATTEAAPAPVPGNAPAPANEPGLAKDAALAAISQPVAPAVPLDKTATVGTGLSAKVTALSAVEGEATGLGEIAGPALQFTVEISNGTGADVPADGVLVMLEYGKEAVPAMRLSGPGVTDFPAVMAKGQKSAATYVFNVPAEERAQVRILLSVDASTPIAAFEGAAPASKGTP